MKILQQIEHSQVVFFFTEYGENICYFHMNVVLKRTILSPVKDKTHV